MATAKKPTSRRSKLASHEVKLDLACGRHRADGFWGVDIREPADQLFDLRKIGWPWADASVDEISCNYFFNYLDNADRMNFMNECHRILKPGGKLVIKVPHWSSMRSISDPLYKWPPICETSFLVFNAEWRKKNEQEHYPISADFDFGYGFSLSADVGQRNNEYQQFAIRHYANAVLDLVVTLTKRT